MLVPSDDAGSGGDVNWLNATRLIQAECEVTSLRKRGRMAKK